MTGDTTDRSPVAADAGLLVLGMHRSGTSMFTRALNLLGMELGQPLMAPQPDNPKGFWTMIIAMALLAMGLLISFRKRGWL